MGGVRAFGALKVASWIVVALMAGAMGYAAFIVLRYWSGIGV